LRNVDAGAGPAVAAEGSLRRSLGLLDSVAIGLGAIIGAGIFVVTGVAAGVAGPSLLAGLAIAGVAAAANALSSAQLAAVYPVAGGTYEYGYRVLGWPYGFAAGWMFLAGKIASAGTVALGLAGYLGVFAPGVPPRWIAVGAVVAFTALNALGVRRSSQANVAIVAVSVGALVTFTIAGAAAFDASNLRPFAPAGWGGALRSAALLFFAYTGYARIATLGEEVRDPATTIPRAVVITIAIAVVLYFAVAVVALGVAGAPALASSPAPLHAAAQRTGTDWLAPVVAAGGIAAMLGVILSQLLGLSRMAYAMARRGDLPGGLAHVSARTAVPVRAILAIGAVATVIAATGTLGGVAAAASFTILLYYAIANLAALRMPAERKRFPDAVPVVGLAACVLLAFALPVRTIAIGLGLLAAGFAVRAVVAGYSRAK
jgi:APA family basic amino acid/polyamine antiporter